ncbi:MAG: pyridoxamine 5'-phosphate oxidase family protein, partial [Candidatus Heimdallarchaeota archaeon]|nr:pyridoxamine 5'-phosphate oxidase family protein [Candidatus Heimdallarchaeota archaeon]
NVVTMHNIRRNEKAITEEADIKSILSETKYITLAMSYDNTPYLVTLSHGYDPLENIIFFHCASEGKKLDYLKSTGEIWGQAIIDKGYAKGECNHHYSSVHFQGEVKFISDIREKRKALTLMIDQLEEDPELRENVKRKQLLETALKRVTIGKILIRSMSGKKG